MERLIVGHASPALLSCDRYIPALSSPPIFLLLPVSYSILHALNARVFVGA